MMFVSRTEPLFLTITSNLPFSFGCNTVEMPCRTSVTSTVTLCLMYSATAAGMSDRLRLMALLLALGRRPEGPMPTTAKPRYRAASDGRRRRVGRVNPPSEAAGRSASVDAQTVGGEAERQHRTAVAERFDGVHGPRHRGGITVREQG